MKYFSGFGLNGDYALFAKLLQDFGYTQNKYDIVGFSSGARLALRHAMLRIGQKKRVGKLILISPLFFINHIFSQDSIPTTKKLTTKKQIFNADWLSPLFKFMPCITHVSFEKIASEFNHLPSNLLWDMFVRACIISYQRDRLSYHSTLYEQLGLNLMNLDKELGECVVSTHFENTNVLRNMWNLDLIDFLKIKQKSQMFVIIMAEHDRILNSKLISKYLSQFGICYIIKGCNHILQKETN